MDSPFFSVIVPIYNVEKYLRECVDSILNQRFTDFELILVDDGSPDNCPAICDEYAQNDDRIRVIHKANGGLSSARNAGLRVARGKYITFCDSDDYWDTEYLEKFREMCDQDNVALAICGFQSVMETGCFGTGRSSEDCPEAEGLHKLDNNLFWALFQGKRIGSCWDKAYKSDIIADNSLTFDESVSCVEDTDFVLRYLCAVGSECWITLTDAKLYLYLTNEHGSLVQRVSPERWKMFEHLFHRLEAYISEDNHRAYFYNYVFSAIVFTLNSIFGYQPKISLDQFSELVQDMFHSSYYKKVFQQENGVLPGNEKVFTTILKSGNAALIWSYYKISGIKQHLLNRK